jgi:D-alanyl-D-alanine carboxypeptidase/D-alanyl-D-alanine-endopeptidase (penicillin-binding protein 4)
MFAEKLKAAGLKVVGKPERIDAPSDARKIAEINSAPLSAIVEHMLVVSDNDVAEALARHVAVAAGKPGTFAEGAAAVTAAVAALGVDTSGLVIHDGSGLSRTNKIPPHALAATLAAAAKPGNEKLRPMLAGLAVAGVNGTLGLHYFIPKAVPGRGLVRCKTGSLTGVVSLACIVPTAEGRLVAFDVVADNVQPGYGRSSRQVFERFSTALLACGC